MAIKHLYVAPLIAALAAGQAALADANYAQAFSFEDLFNEVTENGTITDLSNLLIVMDDDDTLTMMPCPVPGDPAQCQYLGGPAWFSWQSDLIDRSQAQGGVQLPGQVAPTDDALYPISDLLLTLNEMNYADPTIPTNLLKFAQSGAQLLVLTARDTDVVSATQGQLSNLEVQTGESLLDLISEHAPIWSDSGTVSMAGTEGAAFCGMNIPVAYQNGVVYVTGQNKGEVLNCFLSKSEVENITEILFVDDTAANVQDVYETFMDNTAYEVAAVHFTQLAAHKAEFGPTSGTTVMTNYQTAATLRWQALQTALNLTLLNPTGLN